MLHISYFISQGFNYGYNYNRYWEDNRCKDIAPPQKLINLISERREILYIEALREYYKSLLSYIELQQEIKSKNVKVNQPIDILMMQGETCVIPGARKIDDGYISYPIVFINIGTSILLYNLNTLYCCAINFERTNREHCISRVFWLSLWHITIYLRLVACILEITR